MLWMVPSAGRCFVMLQATKQHNLSRTDHGVCVPGAGGCHAHNVSASLVRAINSPAAGWIASSPDDYVDTAAKAAYGLPSLAAMRQQLRPAMLASPLCNGPAFVSQLEQVYADMWEQQWREQHGT